MSKAATLVYALLAYVIFFATFLYLIAFAADLTWAPRTVDHGPEASVPLALIVNTALIALFGLQHSVMARQGFKRAWTRVVPKQMERSTFVLFASIALVVIFLFWRPIDALLWDATSRTVQSILWTLFGVGWLIVLLSTFLINHFELFGLQQAYLYVRGRDAAPQQMRQPLLYRYVRHPLYLGFFLAFWATPHMTVGHLLLAAGMSVYMLIAIRYEERDLVGIFGHDYETYRASVGMLVPRIRRRA